MTLLVTLTMMGSMPLHLFLPALPTTATDLHTSPGIIQLTITLYMLGLAAGGPIYGPLSDHYGRRPVLLAGLALFAISSLFAAFATTAGQLIVARVFQSLGACSGMTLGRAIVRDGTSTEKAAGVMATLGVALSIGPAIAPAIGAYLAEWVGWRAIFVLSFTVGLAVLLAVLLTLPETHHHRTAQIGFLPMLRSYNALVRMPQFIGYTVGGGVSASLFSYLAVLPFIVVDVLHRPLHEVGPYYFAIVIGNAIGSFISNRLVRRLGSRRLASIGMKFVLMAPLLLLLVHFTDSLTVATFIGPATLLAIGVGFLNPNALVNAISADPAAIGAASGLYGSMQMVYGALCTIVVGALHSTSVLPLAIVVLLSALLGQGALSWAGRVTRASE